MANHTPPTQSRQNVSNRDIAEKYFKNCKGYYHRPMLDFDNTSQRRHYLSKRIANLIFKDKASVTRMIELMVKKNI